MPLDLVFEKKKFQCKNKMAVFSNICIAPPLTKKPCILSCDAVQVYIPESTKDSMNTGFPAGVQYRAN